MTRLRTAATIMPNGQSALFDSAVVEVELLHEAMWLESHSDDSLVAGRNLALLGDELFQFGFAEPLGAGRFRLSRLLRGRRGTEAAMPSHAAGERFVLLDPDALKPLEIAAGMTGAPIELLAIGVGDHEPFTIDAAVEGRSVRPPAPVHLSAKRETGGHIRFRWTRRSRLGWVWADGGDAPLGEESEAWRVTIAPDIGISRAVDVAQSSYLYTAAEQAADGAQAATQFSLSVAQMGTLATSNPPAQQDFAV